MIESWVARGDRWRCPGGPAPAGPDRVRPAAGPPRLRSPIAPRRAASRGP